MELQDKLLDHSYIETRLRDVVEIRKKEIAYKIKNSNREFSSSVYIEFYCENKGQWWKRCTLRISDHPITDCPHAQFIVSPCDILTKKKKEQFIKAVEKVISKSRKKNLLKILQKDVKNS